MDSDYHDEMRYFPSRETPPDWMLYDPDDDQLIKELDNEVVEEDVDAEGWGAWLEYGERPIDNRYF